MSGQHTGDILINVAGTATSPITIESSGAKLITSKSGATGPVRILVNYVVFRGFDIQGNIEVDGSSNIIENNTVHDSWDQDGIHLIGETRDDAGTSNNIIRKNVMTNTIKTGIYIVGRNNIIKENEISHVQDSAPDGSGLTDADGSVELAEFQAWLLGFKNKG